jgi:hypothetical protein
MVHVKRSVAFAIGIGCSLAAFGVANYLTFLRRPTCFDCGFERGVPFALYGDPTFNSIARGGEVLWNGAIANIAFAVMSGALLAWLIHRATAKARGT